MIPPHKLGLVENANLEILERASDNPKWLSKHGLSKKYRYHVRYLCCGREGVVTHEQITRRALYGTDKCMPCAKRLRNSPEERLHFAYGTIIAPDWPVPNLIKEKMNGRPTLLRKSR